MKQMKCRLTYGAICEQLVYNVPDGTRKIENYDPEKARRDRFEDDEAYLKFKEGISRRNHLRQFHANFSPTSIYCTPTFDDEWEVHTFEEAKIVRKRFVQAFELLIFERQTEAQGGVVSVYGCTRVVGTLGRFKSESFGGKGKE